MEGITNYVIGGGRLGAISACVIRECNSIAPFRAFRPSVRLPKSSMAAPASAAAAAPAMAAEEAAAKPVLPRKLTPFMIFCGETRADVLRESPDATDEDVGRALAQRWGALSADERKVRDAPRSWRVDCILTR